MRSNKSLAVFYFAAAFACVGFAEDEIVLPSGYIQLDYVAFDEKAYVKTGLTPENGWKIAVDFEPKEVTYGTHCLWCARKSAAESTTSANFNFFYYVDGKPRLDFYGTYYPLSITITAERHLFVLDDRTLSIDGTPIVMAEKTEPFTAGGSLYLFGSYTGARAPSTDWASGKFYGAKIWDGVGKLVMNIVPCFNTEDGSFAFYDTVGAKDLTKGGTFYTWKVGENATAYVMAGTLYIKGWGAVTSMPWTKEADGITKLVKDNGVTGLEGIVATLPALTTVNDLALAELNGLAVGAVKASGFNAIAIDPATQKATLTVVVKAASSVDAKEEDWTEAATMDVEVEATSPTGFFIVAPPK